MNDDKIKNNKHNPEEEPINNEEEIAPEEAASQEQQEIQSPLLDKYIRACADFSNARKRWDREKEELIKFSNSSLIKELLVVLDEAEQALKMVKEHSNIKEIIKGLEMTYNNFLNILKKEGLKQMECVGKHFDPHLHEIIASKEVNENIDKPIVLEEIQKGYLMEGKVLRPARVIVGIHKKVEEKAKAEGKDLTKEEGESQDKL